MSCYAMTGGATGIGAALREQLVADGHQVISVDIKAGDVIADLSTPEGRETAIAGVRELAPEAGLDGLIVCAGLPPVAPLAKIAAVNYFGAVAVAEGLKDLVAKRRGTVLLVSSNSAPMMPAETPFVQACLSGDEAEAIRVLEEANQGQVGYAGSKRALTTWMRRNVVAWAKAGVRLNAVAPGITQTPLTQEVMSNPDYRDAMTQFADMVPWGGTAEPGQIASVMRFMLSEAAGFVCGAVFFVDGGSDAMLRPDSF